MNINDYLIWAQEVQVQLDLLDKPDIPVEAELHIALVRNKLAQILPKLERVIDLYPQLIYHYEQIFECLDLPDDPELYGEDQ